MIEQIIEQLGEVNSQPNDNWTGWDWTKRVKSALCLACRNSNPNLYVCASGVDNGVADDGEWLYDVSAQLYDKDDDRYLIKSALAAECEWGAEYEIYSDFQKLLLARADLRVMVFDGSRSPGYQKIFQNLSRFISRCTHTESGDAWLFAAWTQERFICHQIEAFQAQRNLV